MGAVRESDCYLPVDRREVEWQVVSIDILHKGKNLHSEVGQFPQPPEKRLPSGAMAVYPLPLNRPENSGATKSCASGLPEHFDAFRGGCRANINGLSW